MPPPCCAAVRSGTNTETVQWRTWRTWWKIDTLQRDCGVISFRLSESTIAVGKFFSTLPRNLLAIDIWHDHSRWNIFARDSRRNCARNHHTDKFHGVNFLLGRLFLVSHQPRAGQLLYTYYTLIVATYICIIYFYSSYYTYMYTVQLFVMKQISLMRI